VTDYAAVMIKDSINAWQGWHGVDPAAFFNTKAVPLAQADFQPTVVDSYDVNSARKFAGVWIKKTRTWTAAGESSADMASFDTTMQDFMTARNIPYGALAVTKGSRLVYARGYQWDAYNTESVQPTSLFRIASLTKPLTAAAVMRLVQENALALTDKLVDRVILPPPVDARTNDITLQHLLTHTAGWNRDTSAFDPMFADQVIAGAMGTSLPISQWNIINFMTTQWGLEFSPGTDYNYSNYGYLLLGRVIEALTQVSYAQFMQDHIFGPLGISRIVLGQNQFENRAAGEVPYFTLDPKLYANVCQAGAPVNAMLPYGSFNLANMDAHGGWLASAVDLACFSTAFDSTGRYPILNQASIDQVFAQQALSTDQSGAWYGYGWSARRAGSGLNTWHTGSLPGSSTLMVRRHDGLNWVALFDQRDDLSGASYADIDPALHAAADAVTRWPAGDLFPTYGLPARWQHRAYMPLSLK
jgi:CubicO group peptidase (beta-lactamase class C family)